VLTDNGIQFTNRKRDIYAFQHVFDRVCHEHGIDHRLTKTNHPWTNGQVERMNRTLKEATVKKYDYETHDHLQEHLYAFLMAYNFAKRLKTLKGLTPYEYIGQCWQKDPERFTMDPCHHTLRLNSAEITGFSGASECSGIRRESLRITLCAVISSQATPHLRHTR
jgi:Integrase core domain